MGFNSGFKGLNMICAKSDTNRKNKATSKLFSPSFRHFIAAEYFRIHSDLFRFPVKLKLYFEFSTDKLSA